MRIVQINTFSYKATGNIMFGIHKLLQDAGHESYVVWGRGRASRDEHEIVMDDDLGVKLHGLYTRLTDRTGFASKRSTRKLLAKLDEIQPDIVHLHNIHGYYLNIELLFSYLRTHKTKVVWTMHDCWPITGHCAYFDMVGCEKWKSGCNHCEQTDTYPVSLFIDASAQNWMKKKELFLSQNITIVTPCTWLAKLFSFSFMRDYPMKVIYNGIDLETFKPSYKEEIRKKYSPEGKPIILGVASEWTDRKGLKDFVVLAEKARDLQFVVVGLTEEQVKKMPLEVRAIQRTNNIDELVELYSSADVFFNPTYEDNFPTTNLEALACGTPVLTYNTGGSPESILLAQANGFEGIGYVVKKETPKSVDYQLVDASLRDIILQAQRMDCSNKCRNAALLFDRNLRLKEYVDLYDSLFRKQK